MRIIVITIGTVLVLVQVLYAGGDKDLFNDLVGVARTEAQLGLWPAAAQNYEKALSIPVKKENKIEVFYQLAELYSDDLADTLKALDTYLRITEMFEGPDEIEVALYRTGRLLEELGECYNAVGFYERLIVGYPESSYLDHAIEGSDRCFQKNFKEVAAVIRGQPLSVVELEETIEKLPAVYKTRYSSPDGKREYLDKMIKDRLLELHSRDLGFLDDPEITKRIHEAKLRILSEQFFLAEVRGKVDISDEEIEVYYNDNMEDYIRPEEVKVRHILVESEEEAAAVLADLKAGKNFEDLAKEFSIDIRTKEKGGDLGFIKRGRAIKVIEEAAFSLEPEKISDIVKSKYGYHIVKVDEIHRQDYRSLEEVRNLIKTDLRTSKEQDRTREIISELKEKYGVKIFLDEKKENAETAGDVGK
jgi:peptidyl-prolyl cis-trans isomerase C